MKAITALLLICGSLPICAKGKDGEAEVEMTLMAIGHPSGGKLQSGATGCAVVHFMNRSKETIFLPTAPRGLGKGRVEAWNDASYLSPKQGPDYGWGYRAAYDVPKVMIEFIDVDGAVVHSDSSIQLQRIDVIEPEVWEFSPILFSTPAKPGTYSVRFTFDNRPLGQSSGHNFADRSPARLVTIEKLLNLADIQVIKQKAEQGGAGQPATRSESDSEGDDKPQPEPEGRSR